MVTKIQPSKLTSLSLEKSVLEQQILSRESVQWLTQKILELKRPGSIPNTIKREEFRNTKRFVLGGLYYFFYDPKGKDDLPYYDTFPLVLVLEKYPDGFLGLNLHYLPIKYRVAFLGKLLQLGKFNEDGDPVKIKVTYDILNATKRFKEFRPCIKRYLMPHIKSKILAVQPNEWEVATFLPVHQFKKAKPKEVWEDSIKEIKGL